MANRPARATVNLRCLRCMTTAARIRLRPKEQRRGLGGAAWWNTTKLVEHDTQEAESVQH